MNPQDSLILLPQLEAGMYQQLSEMVEAIHTRRSHRRFIHSLLHADHEQLIRGFLAELVIPFEHNVSVTYHCVPEDKNVVYFKGPRQFLALSAARDPVEQAKLGFIGELLVLFSEANGVHTCWMGHYRAKEVRDIVYADSQVEISDPLYCIILLGYTPEKTGMLDLISKKRMSKKDRTVDSFLSRDSLTDFPAFVRTSLELASRAPSAMNSQKWYYSVMMEDESLSIELGKPRGYQHFKWKHYDIDVGTAAAHLWLGLKHAETEPEVQVRRDEEDSVWKFRLAPK